MSITTAPVIGTVELARLLDVSTDTVLRWVRTGKLPRPIAIRRNFFAWPADVAAGLIDRIRGESRPALLT